MTNEYQPRTRKRPRGKLTLAQRRWMYGIAAALVPVLLTYGLVSEQQAGPLLGLAAAVLGVTGVALKHPTED